MQTDRLAACRLLACAGLLLASAACAPTHVQTTNAAVANAPMAAPELIIVRDFSVAPEAVKLDTGLTARLTGDGGTGTAKQMDEGEKVVGKVSEKLVSELKKRGLPAVREGQVVPTAGQPVLLVDGRMLRIDEGSRTKRAVNGFGAGRSTVKAEAKLLYSRTGGEPLLLSSFTGDAESARKPGAIGTMGAGTLADHLAISAATTAGTTAVSESLGATAEADSLRLAKELAEKVADATHRNGWFSTTASR